MLKIVLDTNIYLSGFLYGGMTEQILDLVVENKLQLLVSPALKKEVIKKFRVLGASKETTEKVTVFIDYQCQAVSPKVKVTICRDAKDNFLLELAESGKADFIITRDKDLLELPQKRWKDSKIMKPEDFLPFLRKIKLIAD